MLHICCVMRGTEVLSVETNVYCSGLALWRCVKRETRYKDGSSDFPCCQRKEHVQLHFPMLWRQCRLQRERSFEGASTSALVMGGRMQYWLKTMKGSNKEEKRRERN